MFVCIFIVLSDSVSESTLLDTHEQSTVQP